MDLIVSSATHRAGSTLVQRIFNARKETLVWGENGGSLTYLNGMWNDALYFSSYSDKERDAYFGGGENPNVWMPNMTPTSEYVNDAVLKATRTFFDTLYSQHKETHDIIGFKEVRFGRDELELFSQCYPDAKIILLIRNPVDTWMSIPNDWYASGVDEFVQQWNDRVRDYIQLNKDYENAHLIKYEDVVIKEAETMKVLKDVGRLNQDQIDNVISVKINSSRTPISDNVSSLIAKNCRKNMQKLGYVK